MPFLLILTEEARNALDSAPPKVRAKIGARLEWLKLGQGWRDPWVKSIQNSDLDGLRELRISFGVVPYCFLFALDSRHQIVVLCGGSKKGKDRFSRR